MLRYKVFEQDSMAPENDMAWTMGNKTMMRLEGDVGEQVLAFMRHRSIEQATLIVQRRMMPEKEDRRARLSVRLEWEDASANGQPL